jgi:hypothetical protein
MNIYKIIAKTTSKLKGFKRALIHIMPGKRDMNVAVKFARKAKIDVGRKSQRKRRKIVFPKQSWFAVNVKV